MTTHAGYLQALNLVKVLNRIVSRWLLFWRKDLASLL